ncbi:MAG: M24 family metallopeptidase [Nocardioidaceae bacterium]
MLFGERGIEIKSPDQIAKMRVAGLLVGRTLELIREAVRPGVTTGSLDALAEDTIRSGGGIPSFLGYGYPPFPATICASVNDEVVHGIPGDRVLHDGDVISVDCGAIVDGWHGDAAITVAVGEVEPAVLELMRISPRSRVWRGFAAARLGGNVGDISHAIESYMTSQPHPESGGSLASCVTTPVAASAPDASSRQCAQPQSRARQRVPNSGADSPWLWSQ